LNPPIGSYGPNPILSSISEKKAVIIEHPKDTINKKTMNLGDVFLPVPAN
jgi:hypothetical protein